MIVNCDCILPRMGHEHSVGESSVRREVVFVTPMTTVSFQMFRVIIVLLCVFHCSECQQGNVTSSANIVRVGASFVSRLLSEKSTTFLPSVLGKFQQSKDSRTKDFIQVLLHLFGIDSKRLQEWALRGFVSMLPLMNKVLTEKEVTSRTRRSPAGFSIFRFILQRPQVAGLVTQMQNPDLVDELLKQSEEKLKDADCVKLLLCKAKPVIKGMQKSLGFFLKQENLEACDESYPELEGEWKKATLEERMYFFLPGLPEMVSSGDECEEEYPNCAY